MISYFSSMFIKKTCFVPCVDEKSYGAEVKIDEDALRIVAEEMESRRLAELVCTRQHRPTPPISPPLPLPLLSWLDLSTSYFPHVGTCCVFVVYTCVTTRVDVRARSRASERYNVWDTCQAPPAKNSPKIEHQFFLKGGRWQQWQRWRRWWPDSATAAYTSYSVIIRLCRCSSNVIIGVSCCSSQTATFCFTAGMRVLANELCVCGSGAARHTPSSNSSPSAPVASSACQWMCLVCWLYHATSWAAHIHMHTHMHTRTRTRTLTHISAQAHKHQTRTNKTCCHIQTALYVLNECMLFVYMNIFHVFNINVFFEIAKIFLAGPFALRTGNICHKSISHSPT